MQCSSESMFQYTP